RSRAEKKAQRDGLSRRRVLPRRRARCLGASPSTPGPGRASCRTQETGRARAEQDGHQRRVGRLDGRAGRPTVSVGPGQHAWREERNPDPRGDVKKGSRKYSRRSEAPISFRMAPLRSVLELILTVLRSGAIQKSAPQAAFKRRTMSDKPQQARSDKPASPSTIVVVDDSKDNRDLYRAALQHQGYNVLFAASGENALQLCRTHKGVIHLILIDVVMPGMSGLQLATKLLPLRPDLKVLFVSAFIQQGALQGKLRSMDGYLSKPFPSELLVTKVQEMLAA